MKPLIDNTLVRDKELKHALGMSVPSAKDDEWKYTRFDEILDGTFEVAESNAANPSSKSLRDVFQNKHDGYNIVFINGFYSEELSSCGNLVVTLQGASKPLNWLYTDIFATMNDTSLQNELCIDIPEDSTLLKPIKIHFIADTDGRKLITQPRLYIKAGNGCNATIVESYYNFHGTANKENSSTSSAYFTNSYTHIVLGRNSKLQHYKIQNEYRGALHLSRTYVHHDKGSSFSSHMAMFGGKVARNEIDVDMNNTGAYTSLRGIYIAKPYQHHNCLVKVNHVAPHCVSEIKYKGVIHEHGSAAFDGLISAKPGAIKTDAKMVNNNLLLSKSAEANTRPRLEILVDDVKCSHGATIAQISSEALFYLRTRGVLEEEARKILTEGFVEEIVKGAPFLRDVFLV
ncbi:MAG: Fe-S cluster assembly protein SufD [Pseudomonadota bacterium]